ncbi:MAG: type II secretion system F family protein [Chloroflexi bacterium]|nr:type II secretion system F family protein [Chloroflexota bacterium]
MDLLLLLIGASLTLAVFTAVVAVRQWRRPGETMTERLEDLRKERPQPTLEDEPHLMRKRSYSRLPQLSEFLAGLRGSEKVALELERAGIPLRVGEYYLIRGVTSFVFFLIPFVFNRGFIGFVFAVGFATLGFLLPALYVSGKKQGRANRINAQLVELLGLVSNSLKSGYGLMQSFEFASRQMRPPIVLELRRMLRENSLGMPAEEAINSLGQRIASPDLDMVLTAINIQRAVGGNLAEILDNVAFTMRERERIRGEIRTLTAQQRMTGIIISGLPVGMALLFMLINPEYMSVLFTETVGRVMLAMAVGFEAVGIFAMKRIMAIEV